MFHFQVYEEFCTSSNALSVEKLIETFVQAKSTGTEKPGRPQFYFTDDIFVVMYKMFYLKIKPSLT